MVLTLWFRFWRKLQRKIGNSSSPVSRMIVVAVFLLVILSTGGYGLTLTVASYVVYFSNSYNLKYVNKAKDRAHRIGQDKNVTYIDLITENTIDEFIVSALDKKLKLSAETLGEEVKQWLK